MAAAEAGYYAGAGALLTLVQRLRAAPLWIGAVWVLTEAADIREAYQRYDLFSNYPSGLPARTGAPPMIPEDLDPPDHTKYRRAISGMFSPRRVHQPRLRCRGRLIQPPSARFAGSQELRP